MTKKRTYICFDYDHDIELKALLVGQSRIDSSPFEIVDMSIKEAISSNWKENARRRIKSCDVVVVLCGKHTNTAEGVTAELTIAREENIPYFLLAGCDGAVRPRKAENDIMYRCTWDNLKSLIAGNR